MPMRMAMRMGRDAFGRMSERISRLRRRSDVWRVGIGEAWVDCALRAEDLKARCFEESSLVGERGRGPTIGWMMYRV